MTDSRVAIKGSNLKPISNQKGYVMHAGLGWDKGRIEPHASIERTSWGELHIYNVNTHYIQ